MNMQYQDLGATKQKIIKIYTKNPNRSISSTFRTLRTQQRISFIGDYPIITAIIAEIINLGITPSRFQVTHALNQSSELRYVSKRIKSELLNQLIYPLYVQTKTTESSLKSTTIKKMNNAVS